ncbi:hypothetical protein NPIL_589121 [Nephila pilipes]|uniref:Uncharacterized protein n=1 Tax=Nephila pilipes TaxID=299642 RepID=A0A8X6Q4Z5_NEPPI|nr:hypothetical protein NPIL_589121 [Nephila pilipes]
MGVTYQISDSGTRNFGRTASEPRLEKSSFVDMPTASSLLDIKLFPCLLSVDADSAYLLENLFNDLFSGGLPLNSETTHSSVYLAVFFW